MRYLLEGSVRLAGNRVRVTVQLVDAERDQTLWSSRFDQEESGDLFAVQDEITLKVCAHLEPRIRVGDISYGNRAGHPTSFRLWQEGWFRLFVDAPAPLPVVSLELFERALELDDNYAPAHAGIAVVQERNDINEGAKI